MTLEAPNWIVAMGLGIEQLSGSTAIERLACEMLPNGTIIARDVRSGTGYVIQPDAEARQVAAEPPTPPPDDEVLAIDEDISHDIESLTFDEPVEETVTSASLSGVHDIASLPELPDASVDVPDQDDYLIHQLDRITDAPTAVVAWELGLEIAQQIAPSAAGAAVQLTPNDGLFFVAAIGPQAHNLKAARLPYGTGFVGFCIDRMVGFTVNDVRRDARHYGGIDQATGFSTRAVLCAPVASDGMLFGCLELLNPPPGGRYTRAQLEQVEIISNTLGERLFRAGLRGRKL